MKKNGGKKSRATIPLNMYINICIFFYTLSNLIVSKINEQHAVSLCTIKPVPLHKEATS
jgi:hypothetical protein